MISNDVTHCESEKVKAKNTKDFVSSLNISNIKIRKIWGKNQSDEVVISLNYKDESLGLLGVSQGYFSERRMNAELEPIHSKKNWCKTDQKIRIGENPDLQFICFSQINTVSKKHKTITDQHITPSYCQTYLDLFNENCKRGSSLSYDESVTCTQTVPAHDAQKIYRILDSWF